MANRTSNGVFLSIDKLAGRSNYRTWAVAIRAYLEVEDLWDTIEAPEDGVLSTDSKKIQKARGRIVLAVETDIYAYLEDQKSAKGAWEALAKTFDDPGAHSKVSLLIELSTTKYENCKSMEDYVAKIIGASQKLNAIGSKIPTDLVGALMLAGLPQSYKLMIMALTSSGKKVTADLVKTKLLEEAQSPGNDSEIQNVGLRAQANSANFRGRANTNRGRDVSQKYSNLKSKRFANLQCYNCNRFGHTARVC